MLNAGESTSQSCARARCLSTISSADSCFFPSPIPPPSLTFHHVCATRLPIVHEVLKEVTRLKPSLPPTHIPTYTHTQTQSLSLSNTPTHTRTSSLSLSNHHYSARRGVAFERPLKHDMGHIEVLDQVAGVQWLVSKGLADPARVGIFGWSYGGYMALMALMRAPDVFSAAVAGAPVTHWDGYGRRCLCVCVCVVFFFSYFGWLARDSRTLPVSASLAGPTAATCHSWPSCAPLTCFRRPWQAPPSRTGTTMVCNGRLGCMALFSSLAAKFPHVFLLFFGLSLRRGERWLLFSLYLLW